MNNEMERLGFNLSHPQTKDDLSKLRAISGLSNSELLGRGISKLLELPSHEIQDRLDDKIKERRDLDQKVRIIRISPEVKELLGVEKLRYRKDKQNNKSLIFETAISELDESDFIGERPAHEAPHMVGITTGDLIHSLSLRVLSNDELIRLKEIIS